MIRLVSEEKRFLPSYELSVSLRTKQWHKYKVVLVPWLTLYTPQCGRLSVFLRPSNPFRFFRPRITHWKTFRAATQLICPAVSFYLCWERERMHRPSWPLSIIPREACACTAFSFRLNRAQTALFFLFYSNPCLPYLVSFFFFSPSRRSSTSYSQIKWKYGNSRRH